MMKLYGELNDAMNCIWLFCLLSVEPFLSPLLSLLAFLISIIMFCVCVCVCALPCDVCAAWHISRNTRRRNLSTSNMHDAYVQCVSILLEHLNCFRLVAGAYSVAKTRDIYRYITVCMMERK